MVGRIDKSGTWRSPRRAARRRFTAAYFTEKAAAEAKALELVEKAGLQRQVKPVATLSELPVFHPKVPYPGVTWEPEVSSSGMLSAEWREPIDISG